MTQTTAQKNQNKGALWRARAPRRARARHTEKERERQRRRETERDGEAISSTVGTGAQGRIPQSKKILTGKTSTKKQVRKDVKDRDTSIYEYRNGSLWWSRETNSTILDATRPAVGMALGGGAKQTHQVRPLCFMTLLVEKKIFFFPLLSPSRFCRRMSTALSPVRFTLVTNLFFIYCLVFLFFCPLSPPLSPVRFTLVTLFVVCWFRVQGSGLGFRHMQRF